MRTSFGSLDHVTEDFFRKVSQFIDSIAVEIKAVKIKTFRIVDIVERLRAGQARIANQNFSWRAFELISTFQATKIPTWLVPKSCLRNVLHAEVRCKKAAEVGLSLKSPLHHR